MKRIMMLALLTGLTCAAWSQTMKIHRGAVSVAVPVATAGEMTYSAGGTALTVQGVTYQISEIDSITVDRSEVVPNSVNVRYEGNRARVEVSSDVMPHLTIQTTGADVSVTAAADFLEEIYYTLSGRSDDGSFFMEGEFKSTVTLDNLTLTNADGPAIDIANGKRIDVIVPDGTTTTLADGAGGTHKACFFVNGHPEFKGGGVLQITGNTKHAFASDEYTRLKDGFGTLRVLKAVGDGLHIEQYFLMQGGNVIISNTGGDCVDVSITNDPLDEMNGQAIMEGGSLKMTVAADDVKGMKCDSAMTISGGTIEAGVTGQGAKGLSVGTDLLIQQKTTVPTSVKMIVTGGTFMPGDPLLEAKCRGIKVDGNFVFDGGDINITVSNSAAKAINVDGTYTYKSGTINCFVDAAQTLP